MRIATTESKLKRRAESPYLSRMSELDVCGGVETLHSSLPDSQTGWLGGFAIVTSVPRSILLHGDLHINGPVDELAMNVGLSRSALGEGFTQLIGHSPMQYLNELADTNCSPGAGKRSG